MAVQKVGNYYGQHNSGNDGINDGDGNDINTNNIDGDSAGRRGTVMREHTKAGVAQRSTAAHNTTQRQRKHNTDRAAPWWTSEDARGGACVRACVRCALALALALNS